MQSECSDRHFVLQDENRDDWAVFTERISNTIIDKFNFVRNEICFVDLVVVVDDDI